MNTQSQNMFLVLENAGCLVSAKAPGLSLGCMWEKDAMNGSSCLSSLEESNYVSIDFQDWNSNSLENAGLETLLQGSLLFVQVYNLFTSAFGKRSMVSVCDFSYHLD